MKRTVMILLSVLLLLGSSASTVLADKDKDDGKKDTKVTAELCKKNGWKDLENEDGEPFKNQGQCVSYAKHGGELQGIEPDADDDQNDDDGSNDDHDGNSDDDNADTTATATAAATSTSSDKDSGPMLTMVDGREPWDGFLTGTGFTPDTTITEVTFASDRTTLNLKAPVGTEIDADGAFQTPTNSYWCTEFDGHGETRGTITVVDSSGFDYAQEFDMEEYCTAGN